MPTLFRLLATVGVVVAMAYGAMFSLATFLQPEPRMIVEAVALPQDALIRSGRSAAAIDRLTRGRQPSRHDR